MITPLECCPVCDLQIDNSRIEFCPNCSWELIIIPDSASQGLKNYYKEKLGLHKKVFIEISKLKKSISSLEAQVENIEEEKKASDKKNKQLSAEINNHKSHLVPITSLRQTISENEKKINQLTISLEKEKEKYKKEQAAHQATKTKSSGYKFNPK